MVRLCLAGSGSNQEGPLLGKRAALLIFGQIRQASGPPSCCLCSLTQLLLHSDISDLQICWLSLMLHLQALLLPATQKEHSGG